VSVVRSDSETQMSVGELERARTDQHFSCRFMLTQYMTLSPVAQIEIASNHLLESSGGFRNFVWWTSHPLPPSFLSSPSPFPFLPSNPFSLHNPHYSVPSSPSLFHITSLLPICIPNTLLSLPSSIPCPLTGVWGCYPRKISN
jgi:hypothetical protein